ncbi:MAG: hypothetical protein SangKO_092510 [Sandaracinaceae bacterium]
MRAALPLRTGTTRDSSVTVPVTTPLALRLWPTMAGTVIDVPALKFVVS